MSAGDRVEFEADRVTIAAAGRSPWRFELAHVRTRLLWAHDESDPHTQRGHAYLIDTGDGPIHLLRLVHGEVDHDGMMALLDRVESTVGHWWRAPSHSPMSLTMHAGVVEQCLAGRTLVHHARPDYAELCAWPELPEAFVRDPVGAWVLHEVGAVSWPAIWRAAALCPRFRGARAGDCRVMTGCRYGSRFADIGQDRTAAVFLSTDAGACFTELAWRLGLRQQLSPAGQNCWPPEQIQQVRVTPAIDGAVVEIEWDDPWIDWDPGTEWKARWSPGTGIWTLRER